MGSQANKDTVKAFFDYFSLANTPQALGLLADDVTWQAMGTEGGPPMSTLMDKDGIGELIQVVSEMFPDGLAFTYVGWTAEGDRVAVEMDSYGVKSNGTIYNNPYHFLVTFSDNKIIGLKEYMDTLHAKSVFIDDI
ncbi:nuclear transport factor 2 family protein [Photobacterium sp. DNB23_23_1]